jgi:hypothetical protein
LKELQEELRDYGIHAFEDTGTREEKLAEMAEKLTLALKQPEPAPEAKKLIETLLQRCFLWTATIKAKYEFLKPCLAI